jgi:hypothetical protein
MNAAVGIVFLAMGAGTFVMIGRRMRRTATGRRERPSGA